MVHKLTAMSLPNTALCVLQHEIRDCMSVDETK